MGKIRVLVVEDSLVFRELLVANLSKDPAIEVVAAAKDPYEARTAIEKYKPDVMTLDIELPKMNGIEFLRKLMPQYPFPVVVISSLSDKVFDAMNAGAVDFVAKPQVRDHKQIDEFIKRELPDKIKIAAVAKVDVKKIVPSNPVKPKVTSNNKNMIVAIGASTGGPEALESVLRGFGPDIPGVVIVQHMPARFTEKFAKRLDQECSVHVKEAKSGDVVMPGQVLIAPGGETHMQLIRVNGVYQVVCKPAEKVNGHRPSVDVLFHSVASVAKKNALGIILTGMGGDGAQGLLAMRNAGAKTIGQSEASCAVYGMPRVAYEIGAVEYQEHLMDIPERTYELINKM